MQANNLEAERMAREIRIRAERGCGRELAAMVKSVGGRPVENLSADTTGLRGAKTLPELGISRDQSSRWQQLAAIPVVEVVPAPSQSTNGADRCLDRRLPLR
jgi:hypothetical protein